MRLTMGWDRTSILEDTAHVFEDYVLPAHFLFCFVFFFKAIRNGISKVVKMRRNLSCRPQRPF